jgi:hypothetical protein
MMRQDPDHTTKTSACAHRRLKSVRAVLFGFVALVIALQGFALTLCRAQTASDEGIVAVSTAVSVDCTQEDPNSPPSDGRLHNCLLAGLCCLPGCEGQAWFGLAGAASSAAAWSRSVSEGVERYAPAWPRLALAGWASAWSSRAPPPAA